MELIPQFPGTSRTIPHGTLLDRALSLTTEEMKQTSLKEAREFYRQIALEMPDLSPDWTARLKEVEETLLSTGSYLKTKNELSFAAQIAWRNNIRCIGRHHWRSLRVLDCRTTETVQDVFEALVEHLRISTNGGNILPLMSIYSQKHVEEGGVQIFNYQLVRYAGYRSNSSKILGDPHSVEITTLAIESGWKPPHDRTPFDILPILIKDQNNKIWVFELPKEPELVLEIPIRHPDFAWFEKLGLKWYAVPAICNMVLDAGGLKYPTNVFNGWYMGTEIASRNLGDIERYNMIPQIGEMMGLPTNNDRSLWRDKALVELNIAVLNSFENAGVRISDHHTAAQQFIDFGNRETREGRRVCGDWAWLVPPLSGSACPIFHRSYSEDVEKPALLYRAKVVA